MSYYEEETSYVLFDLGDTIEKSYIEQAISTSGGCRITGLEEGDPYLQIGDTAYQGEIDETLGTHMLFQLEERKVETEGLLPLLSSIRYDNESSAQKQKYDLKYDRSIENIVRMDTITLEKKEKVEDTKMEEVQEDPSAENSLVDVLLSKNKE